MNTEINWKNGLSLFRVVSIMIFLPLPQKPVWVNPLTICSKYTSSLVVKQNGVNPYIIYSVFLIYGDYDSTKSNLFSLWYSAYHMYHGTGNWYLLSFLCAMNPTSKLPASEITRAPVTNLDRWHPGTIHIKIVFPCMVIPIIKIRRSWDRLILILEISILTRHFYTETAPCWR